MDAVATLAAPASAADFLYVQLHQPLQQFGVCLPCEAIILRRYAVFL